MAVEVIDELVTKVTLDTARFSGDCEKTEQGLDALAESMLKTEKFVDKLSGSFGSASGGVNKLGTESGRSKSNIDHIAVILKAVNDVLVSVDHSLTVLTQHFVLGFRDSENAAKSMSSESQKYVKTVFEGLVKSSTESTDKGGKSAIDFSKKIAEAGRSSADAFSGLRNQLAAITGTLAGGYLTKLFLDVNSSDAAIGRFSKTVGLLPQQIVGWQYAARQLGLTSDEITSSMGEMNSKIQGALANPGSSQIIQELNSYIGKPVNGKKIDEIYLMIADRLKKESDNMGGGAAGLQRAIATGQQFFHLSPGVAQLLAQGSGPLRKQFEEAEKEKKLTENQAKQADELRKVFDKLSVAFNGLISTLSEKFKPEIIFVTDKINEMITMVNQNPDAAKGIFAFIVAGITAVGVAWALSPMGRIASLIGLVVAGGASLAAYFGMESKGLGFDASKLVDFFNKHLNPFSPAVAAPGGSEYNPGLIESNKTASEPDWIKSNVAPFVTGAGHAGDKEAQLLKYFSQYWTKEQASGIVSNLKAESNFDPKLLGDKNPKTGEFLALGIAQWHPDRQRDFARLFGHDMRQSNLAEQAAFVQYELTKGTRASAGKHLALSTGGASSGEIVSREYEAPKAADKEASNRGLDALRIMTDSDLWSRVRNINSAGGIVNNTNQSNKSSSDNSNTITVTVGSINVNSPTGSAVDIVGHSTDKLSNLIANSMRTGLM